MFFKTKKKKGVTLIEVLASLAILALLIIPIANLVIHSSGTAKKSQDKQKASAAGQSVLEQMGNIDDSGVANNVYNFQYTNMEGKVDSGKVQFPLGTTASTSELADSGISRYKIYVTLEKEMEHKSAAERSITLDTGDNFFDKYSESALALQLTKKNANDKIIEVYNPNDPSKGVCSTISNDQNYVIYIGSNGICDMYYNANSSTDEPKLGSLVNANIGKIDNSHNKLRIFLAGNKKLNFLNKSDATNAPFSGDLNLSVLSDYPGISNLQVDVTKGEDASTILSMPVKLGNAVAGSINVTEYSAENDLNKKLGDLYKVTVEVRPDGTTSDENIFSGSTTCNKLTR